MRAAAYPPARLAWGVWGLGAALYLIGFYQRVAPAVITGELTADFGLTAAALGNLSAFYFYSYVAMQVPTGIIADRWGPRRLLTAGALVAGAGTLLFALAPNLWVANAGRLLIGGSVAVAFVGMLKIASHWFVPRQFALASGMALFTGIVGAVFAGVPLRLLVNAFDWQTVMVASAIVTLALAAAIWWLVRDDPTEKGYATHFAGHGNGGDAHSVLGGLREVFRYRNTWLLFLIPGGVAGPLLAFAGLWGVPYLTTHYRLSTAEAAAVTSTLMVAWALGGPFFGHLSDRLGHRKPLYAWGLLAIAGGWAVALFLSPPYPLLVAVLAVVGFFSGCMMPGFAFAKESVPPQLAGTVSGVINMGVMTGPMVLQPAVGWMLDRLWTGTMENGARLYDLSAYRTGFALMMAWTAIALVLILFTRDTHCKQAV